MEQLGRYDHVIRLPNRLQCIDHFAGIAQTDRPTMLVLVTLAEARHYNEILCALGLACSEDEGHPNLQCIAPLRIGQSFKEVLEADLAGEYEACIAYKASRELCEELGDYVSRNLFESLLTDEEGHIDFLETQLELLDRIGAEKYGQLNSASAD
ncbi:MAG: hypothetical protein MO846_03195 [Candidatus Devosia symbiotica]|nr:hypothetical protein [Candidatus Devosia symbiotica]